MNRWFVFPLCKLNQIEFSMAKAQVRSLIDRPYEVIRKSAFVNSYMDVYDDFHISYDEKDCLESVEFFSDVEIFVEDKLIFPGTIKNAISIIPDLCFDGYGYISKEFSVGITVDDDDNIEGILFGKKGYYF